MSYWKRIEERKEEKEEEVELLDYQNDNDDFIIPNDSDFGEEEIEMLEDAIYEENFTIETPSNQNNRKRKLPSEFDESGLIKKKSSFDSVGVGYVCSLCLIQYPDEKAAN